MVNFEKSLFYFSNNVENEIRNQIVQMLGVHLSNNPKKHLGLPIMVGRRKKHAFVVLKDKFVKSCNHGVRETYLLGGRKSF